MITGVPAVGKSTLVQSILIPEMLKRETFGRRMFEIGRKENLVKENHDLESLSLSERKDLQRKAAESINKDFDGLPGLIDGHMIVDSKSGFVPDLPLECVSTLKLSAIILLSSKPEDIITRRSNLMEKYSSLREWNSSKRIIEHHEILQKACVNYMLMSEAHYEVLENEENNIEKTLQNFLELLKVIVPHYESDRWKS